MLYDDYLRILDRCDELIAAFESHPDERTREDALELLSAIDLLHREGIVRLVDELRRAGGADLVQRLADDSVVRILLGLYGLADLGLPEDETPSARPPRPAGGFVPAESLTVRRRPR
jgi:hypothetical protein